MRVLVVCQRYWPEQFQIVPICEGLVERGHEVTVLCGLPNVGVPEGEPGVVLPEYRHGQRREESHNGVRIVRSFEVGRRSDIVHRVLNYYSFWHSAKRKVFTLEGKFDVVFAYQLSPAMMSIPAAEYGSKTGVPVYLYCCDLWPESLKAMLGDKGGAIIAHYGKICRKLYQSVDRIGIESPAFREYFEEYHHIPSDKLVYYPQFSSDDVSGLVEDTPHEGVNLLFMGNMGTAQNIPCILRAVSLLDDVEKLTMHFVGDGVMLDWAERYVEENGLADRVVFHGRRPVEEMPRYYALADICVLAFDVSNLIGSAIPAKLQGYMAAGKAVVGSVDGGARFIIEDSGCGMATSPNDAEAMAEAIRELVASEEDRDRCGEAGRRYYKEHFTKQAYLDALEEELRVLISETENEREAA